jgi:hypothetical protein
MAVERKEHVQVTRDSGYERQQRVVEYAPSTRQIIVSRLSMLAWLIVTVIVGMISFRFVLMLVAANPANGFVDLIYDLTGWMVTPFSGIISNITDDTGMVIETASLFAIVVYSLAASLLISLFRILFADTNRSRRVSVIEEES